MANTSGGNGSRSGRSGQPRVGWEFFGSELKRRREESGFTQQELGERVFCSGAYIGQFETAVRKPQLDIAQRIDEELQTGGFFARMCEELINSSPFADYFTDAAELQGVAEAICEWSPTLVPGLLQTEGYARAIFRAAQPFRPAKEREDWVRSRMERTRLLDGPTGPSLWVIVDEGVLRRPIGSDAEMAAQLHHLAEMAHGDRVLVQVLPFKARAHALLEGNVTLMTFTDAPPVAYVEGPYSGQLLDDPATVTRCETNYDLARAAALPPEESVALIESAAKEYGRGAEA